MTPTQRSLALLRGQGYTADVVERWIPRANVRKDLFGIFDIIAIRDGETLAVQCTTTGVASRCRKIAEAPTIDAVRAAGWGVVVHGWRKVGKPPRWACRVVDLS